MRYIFKISFARFLPLFLLVNSLNLPVKSSSSLAAWSLGSDGVLEIRTKSNSRLKAYYQKANDSFGGRFWIDFMGELKTPRTIAGNGPIKEIRLGKPSFGKTRLVIEFKENNKLDPLTWKLIGVDQNRWKIKLDLFPKGSFRTINEGDTSVILTANKNNISKSQLKRLDTDFLQLPNIKRNKFKVVLDPGHGGLDVGAVGVGGLKESDVVLDVSRVVRKLLLEKGIDVVMTRSREVSLDLSPRVDLANRSSADIFVSIHANASRGKRKEINGLETFYYTGWRGRLLAEKIQTEILKVSPGSPDRGVRRGRYFVIKKTNMPAVLVEIGFLTGRLDARRLEKKIHRQRIAYAIAKGIIEYLKRVG